MTTLCNPSSMAATEKVELVERRQGGGRRARVQQGGQGAVLYVAVTYVAISLATKEKQFHWMPTFVNARSLVISANLQKTLWKSR